MSDLITDEMVDSAARAMYEDTMRRLGVSTAAPWERALRAVLELHRPIEVEPSDTICAACSNQLPNGRFLPVVEWPCSTVTTIQEALG